MYCKHIHKTPAGRPTDCYCKERCLEWDLCVSLLCLSEHFAASIPTFDKLMIQFSPVCSKSSVVCSPPFATQAAMDCGRLCGWQGRFLIGPQMSCLKPSMDFMKTGGVRAVMASFAAWRGFQCTWIAMMLRFA